MRPRPLTAAVLLAGTAACSPFRLGDAPAAAQLVTQPRTAYVDGMASVCVIRTARLAAGSTFVVRDNDVLVGATRGPSYFCYRAQPGRHRIVVASEDAAQTFDVVLAERVRYYLDQGLRFDFGVVVPQGAWVDEDTAAALIQRSQHRILQGAPASETLLVGTDVVGALPP